MGRSEREVGKVAQMCTYKAIVLVSLGQQKVVGLLDGIRREELKKKLLPMAKDLRNQPGVRHIEGILIQNWRSDSQGIAQAPWKPAGALIGLEARDEKRLQDRISNLWDVAKKYDQEIMVLEPLGDVDMW